MKDALWNGIQCIDDYWIMKADEDAVKKHFQNNRIHDEEPKNTIMDFSAQRENRRSARKGFHWAVFAACACLCICAAAMLQHFDGSPRTLLRMESAVMEVSSAAEMKDYLGFSVPVLESKNVSAYFLYTSGEYAEKGCVIYDDGSSFQITAEDKTTPENTYATENISGVDVQYGSDNGHIYAAWSYHGYSCRYYDYIVGSSSILSNGESPDDIEYQNEISSLIQQMK